MLGSAEGKVDGKGRFLTLREKAACMGFKASSIVGVLDDRDVHAALGNSMAVPSVGRALAPVMKIMRMFEVQQWQVPQKVAGPSEQGAPGPSESGEKGPAESGEKVSGTGEKGPADESGEKVSESGWIVGKSGEDSDKELESDEGRVPAALDMAVEVTVRCHDQPRSIVMPTAAKATSSVIKVQLDVYGGDQRLPKPKTKKAMRPGRQLSLADFGAVKKARCEKE